MSETTTPNNLVSLPSLPFPDRDSSWRDDARCRGIGPDIFYPPRGNNGIKAKLTCFGCTVRKQCAEFAINNAVRDGIFGGFTDKERRSIRHNRRPNAITLADVLRCAFYDVHNTYPRKDDQWFWKYSKDVIEIASHSTGLSMTEIYKNIDNASDYFL